MLSSSFLDIFFLCLHCLCNFCLHCVKQSNQPSSLFHVVNNVEIENGLLGNFFRFGTNGHYDKDELVIIYQPVVRGQCDLTKHFFFSRINVIIPIKLDTKA